MAKRGALNVPVVGVASSKWSLAQLRKRATDSIRTSRQDRRSARPAPPALPAALRRRRLQRSGHVQSAQEGIGQCPASGALPRDPARAVRHGHQGARRRRPGRRGARHRRKAVRTRPGFGAQPEPRRSFGVPAGLDLPHRSLPGEGGDHEHPVFPLRQFIPRADLEPQLRGERSDHAVRGFRRRQPRRVLRNRRLPARRGPEPSVPDRRAARHGAADLQGVRRGARRNRRRVPGHAPAEARRPGARPVRRLPQGEGRGEAIPTSRRSAPCGFTSTRGAGQACHGTCVPASVWPRRRPR